MSNEALIKEKLELLKRHMYEQLNELKLEIIGEKPVSKGSDPNYGNNVHNSKARSGNHKMAGHIKANRWVDHQNSGRKFKYPKY